VPPLPLVLVLSLWAGGTVSAADFGDSGFANAAALGLEAITTVDNDARLYTCCLDLEVTVASASCWVERGVCHREGFTQGELAGRLLRDCPVAL
jgi:hypothetical protein